MQVPDSTREHGRYPSGSIPSARSIPPASDDSVLLGAARSDREFEQLHEDRAPAVPRKADTERDSGRLAANIRSCSIETVCHKAAGRISTLVVVNSSFRSVVSRAYT